MKIIKYIILSLILFIGINVYAEGPSQDGEIAIRHYPQTLKYIYSNSNNTTTEECMNYDESSNTLTINNCNLQDMYIDFSNMGDVKLNVVGENSIYDGYHSISATYTDSLTVYGSGTLNIKDGIDAKNLYIKDITINIEVGNSSHAIYGKDYISVDNVTINALKVNNEVMQHIFWINNSEGTIEIKDSTITGYADVVFSSEYDDTSLIINNLNLSINGDFDDNQVYSGTNFGNVSIANSNFEINKENFAGITAEENLTIVNSKIKLEKGYLEAPKTIINESEITLNGYIYPYGKLEINNSRVNLDVEESVNVGIIAQDIDINNSEVYVNNNSMIGIYVIKLDINNSTLDVQDIKNTNMPFQLPFYIYESGTENPITIGGNSAILKGGNLYNDCKIDSGETMCLYYFSDTEIEGSFEAFENAIDDNASSEDLEKIEKVSQRVLIGIPQPEIINNVPNTGIVKVLCTIIGLGALGFGVYLIYNKKEAIN